MSVSDPIADMLTKIRNACQRKHEKVDLVPSKLKLEIVKILKNEGYIKNFKKLDQEGRDYIRVFLRYDEEMKSVINGIERVSRPGRRVYVNSRSIPTVLNNYGVSIITTSAGVTTGSKAVEQKVGGELICKVW